MDCRNQTTTDRAARAPTEVGIETEGRQSSRRSSSSSQEGTATTAKAGNQPISYARSISRNTQSSCFNHDHIDTHDHQQPPSFIVIMANKLYRTAGAPEVPPTETENVVIQALQDLESNVADMSAELRALQISSAKEVEVKGGKKAVLIFVPVPQLAAYRKIQQRCVLF